MADSTNDLGFSVDPGSIIAAFKAITKAQAEMQAGTVGGVERMNAAVGKLADNLGSYTSRTEQAQRRMVKSWELSAAQAGQSSTDKIRTRAEANIKALGLEGAAADKVRVAMQRLIDTQNKLDKGAGGGGHGFSSPGMLAFRGVKDLFEGRTAYGEVMLGRSLGLDKALTGLSGAPAVLAGAAAGFTALGVASFHAYKSLGDYGQELSNVSARTGLSLHQVQAFSFAAKTAGEDVSIFERSMRGLTAAAYDDSVAGEKARQWMSRFGIDAQSLRDGTLSTADAMKSLGAGFSSLPAGVERTRAEIELLKRAGIESGPVFLELTRDLRNFEEHGFGQSDETLKGLKTYHDSWAIIGEAIHDAWVDLQLILAVPIGAVAGRLARPGRAQQFGRTPAEMAAQEETEAGVRRDFGPAYEKRVLQAKDTAALAAYRASLGPEYRLKEAEKALGAIPTPELRVTGTMEEAIAARRTGERRVESAKEAVKFYEQHKATIEALRKMSIEESERLAHPYGFIPADKLLKEFAERPGGPDVESARRLLAPLRRAQILQLQQKAIALGQEGAERAAVATGFTGEAKSPEQLSQEIRNRGALQSREFENEQRRLESQRTEAQRTTIDTLREQRRSEEAAGLSAARIAAATAPDTIEARLANEQRIAQVRLRTIADEYRENVESAKDVYDRELKLEELRLKNVHEVAAVQAQLDEARAGEIRKQLDEIKGTAKGLFETLFTHPGQFGAQLGSTIRSALLAPITSGLADTASRALHPLIFGESGTGGIAGGLRGVFGGSTRTAPIGTASDPVAVVVVGAAGGGAGGSVGRVIERGGTVSQPLGSSAMLAMLTGLSFAGQAGAGVGGGAPPGQVTYGSSDITGLSDSGIFGSYGALGALGGTAGFAGPYSMGGGGGIGVAGGAGGGGGILGSLRGLLGAPTGLRGAFSGLKNIFSSDTLAGFKGNLGNYKLGGMNTGSLSQLTTGPFAGTAAGGLAAGAGLALALHGLTGNSAGTWGGIAQGAAGGFLVAGPIGAAIGAGIGIGEKLAGVESPRNEAKRLIRQQYGISINNPAADQIVSIARQTYGSRVSIAVRSPEVRQMLGIYAAGTGQSFAPSASSPHGASLAESGGSLYQQSVYQFGKPYTYASALPTYQGVGGGLLSGGGGGGGSAPTYVSLNFDSKSAGDALRGEWVTPSYVQSAQATAWQGSHGRVQSALALASPGDSAS